MSVQLIRTIIAFLLLYLWGWIDHRLNVPPLISVPKGIAFFCGVGETNISKPGIAFQWLAYSYFIGIVVAIFKHRYEDVIISGEVHLGVGDISWRDSTGNL